MPTPFTDIYSRAVNEFDDPFINAQYNNKINFFSILNGYLRNAIPQFTIPTSVSVKLKDVTNQSGSTELFDGDGTTTRFAFTNTPPIGSYFRCEVDESEVECEFDYMTGELVLSEAPPVGVENVLAEWYFAGEFNQELSDQEQRILSFLLVVNWASKERNHLLDIRRLLSDTDFKMHSEANNMNAKFNWYESLREEASQMMKAYAWQLYLPKLNERYGIVE